MKYALAHPDKVLIAKFDLKKPWCVDLVNQEFVHGRTSLLACHWIAYEKFRPDTLYISAGHLVGINASDIEFTGPLEQLQRPHGRHALRRAQGERHAARHLGHGAGLLGRRGPGGVAHAM